jgi:hypothetical protein
MLVYIDLIWRRVFTTFKPKSPPTTFDPPQSATMAVNGTRSKTRSQSNNVPDVAPDTDSLAGLPVGPRNMSLSGLSVGPSNLSRIHNDPRQLAMNTYHAYPLLEIPVNQEPVGQEPVVQAPTAQAPVVQAPIAQAPIINQAPITQAPVVQAPVAQAPVVQAPVAQAPVAQAPVAQAPVAQAPVAQAPVAQAPIVNQAPITQAPVAQAPIAQAPIGQQPPRPTVRQLAQEAQKTSYEWKIERERAIAAKNAEMAYNLVTSLEQALASARDVATKYQQIVIHLGQPVNPGNKFVVGGQRKELSQLIQEAVAYWDTSSIHTHEACKQACQMGDAEMPSLE